MVTELNKIRVTPVQEEQRYAYTINEQDMTIILKAVKDKGYKVIYD